MIPTNTPDVLLRTFILFITLLVLTRILGKKQMSHLTFLITLLESQLAQ
ncbi:hypothetical protein [Clostridium beijerinckii]|nr:hypothetical protein [Clostridium beijerinckii]NRT29630.1 uncharacterized membrane protein YcaP (DUF421 family) [Clostridium beijerinckii]NRY01424.1 uncharacterized membrane protein YcaP (DUF421 family) [Clostridium beijerinckii]